MRFIAGLVALGLIFINSLTIVPWAYGVEAHPVAASKLSSGVEKSNFASSNTASDDFFKYVNGTWLEKTEIPSDQARWGSFSVLDDLVKVQIRDIIEEASKNTTQASNASKQVGNLYRSFTDIAARNSAGGRPIAQLVEDIQKCNTKEELIKVIAALDRIGVPNQLSMMVDQDARQADRYVVHLYQSGLSLPDRDYYLQNEQRFEAARTALKEYIGQLYELAKIDEAKDAAEKVLEFEKAIAGAQWSNVQLRDPIKNYNKTAVADLKSNYPNLHWDIRSEVEGLPALEYVIVGQPSFFKEADRLMAETPLDTLKAYTLVQTLDAFADSLSEDFEKAHFEFHQVALSGVSEQEPLWKRAVLGCNRLLGMNVGQLYVDKHFPPEAKERMNRMVDQLKAAFKVRIEGLDWMSPVTKHQALEKLSKFTHKIGYPDHWKDYSTLEISANNLVANLNTIAEFEHRYAVAKLGKPIDRGEWVMPPQTVNAYYNPQMNEIVFPAGILQPPFFNLQADDAVNYGGIGAVIGHEISHGFDDQGSQYYGDGNLGNWWSEKDRTEFERRSKQLVEQYGKYRPFDDMSVNGELTLGENIGDLGGLNAAYTAYHLSIDDKQGPNIDGYTADQRLFIGWAQVWRCKYRETELRKRLLTDPHSPTQYRANGIVSNLDAFYDAFDVKPGDKMYIAPEKRVRIW